MPTFKIPQEVRERPVEWLKRSPKIQKWLKANGFVTVSDVINRQAEIPEDYMLEIKKKIILGI